MGAVFGAVGGGTASADSNSDGARDAACEFARNLSSYDYRDVDGYNARVLALTTGELRERLSRSQATLAQLLIARQVHAEAGKVVCDVESDSGVSVRVRVAAEQVVTSQESGQPQSSTTDMVVTEQNVDGLWLASDMDTVG
ncbi:hypothetical protein ACFYTQ_31175 [Nocardia sp. NPDC004068]|uniref:hypothetical protein n=1 Tax=Nocardia sp. NPDC004068 TaxID=3364303 RepID=UPI003689C82F